MATQRGNCSMRKAPKGYVCSICKRTFSSESYLKFHENHCQKPKFQIEKSKKVKKS